MRLRIPLLIAVALAPNRAVFATDDPAESRAIRGLERLGAIVERDHKRPGSPVTGIRFARTVVLRTKMFRCSNPSQI